MTGSPLVRKLADEILSGADHALSRGLTVDEYGGDAAEALLDLVYSHTGRAHIVGITGSPGCGKSTLTRALARTARQRGFTVGVVAIDPSSPFSGGAILGDRIRMNDVAVELGVFIRSLATRGAFGGLSRAAAGSIELMDAAGKELIFVETVGVGQDEVDVMQAVHTVLVVSVPGLGDEIQTLKAGILEIADIHVVNKADREGANRVCAELEAMLALNSSHFNGRCWRPPVLSCVASREEGISPLFTAITGHLQHLKATGEYETRLRSMLRARVTRIAHDFLNEAASRPECESDDLLERAIRRELSPHAVSRAILARMAKP